MYNYTCLLLVYTLTTITNITGAINDHIMPFSVGNQQLKWKCVNDVNFDAHM